MLQETPSFYSGSLNGTSSPLSPAFIESEVQVYLNDFQDQPYCVFDKDWLLENACLLPSEVVFPLVALTRRLSVNSPGIPGRKISTGKYCAERAWRILSTQYRDGKTGLSFLQGTFLVAQLDFAGGNAHRGCNSVALGLRLIQSAGLNQGKNLPLLSKSEGEATRRIIWAYFMLDRAYNASRNYSLCLSDNHFILSYPSSGGFSSHGPLYEKSIKQGQKDDQNILACLLKLYLLWGKATEWVFEPMVSSTLPPWQTGSALSILESEWMDFETEFVDTHRYVNVDFRRRAREDPKSRPYLSTWLCVQFLFHGIQCLLHHPFVTMIKLREMSGNISATFLQKSFETSLLHSRWIARFIREMSEVDLRLCDPFFGYLAAIAATIQVEHTGNKNPQVAILVNNEYHVLLGFITELSTQWENMGVLVNRVNKLASRRQNHGSLFYNQDRYSGALSTIPTPSNLPRMSTEDEALMWDILDLTSSSSLPVAAGAADVVSGYGEEQQSKTITKINIPAPPIQAEPKQIVRDPKSNKPSIAETIIGGLPQLVEETSTPQWPFARSGNMGPSAGMPDIPDWVLFGDFITDHP
ncbi:hypothetical protein N7495_006696 [Penicillium taxi]|uniref:uncharacterized protein n=1 Tax=Penicillium taxi TaxID=168475 RepID=UPI00254503DE|nr:uncharacterized protein N7495_006696 [Penicillium taxi]KAJ5895005.1 hypothetical protein N7495_006696 [Penicillium taxi]